MHMHLVHEDVWVVGLLDDIGDAWRASLTISPPLPLHRCENSIGRPRTHACTWNMRMSG